MTEATKPDVAQFKKLESAASTGNHQAEMELSQSVFDLMKSNPTAMNSIGKQLQREGQQVKFDNSGGVLSIDDGRVSVVKQKDGDIAVVKRDASGQKVDEIAYKDGSYDSFKYGPSGAVDSWTQHRPGKPDQTLPSVPGREIEVDHNGNLSLVAKDQVFGTTHSLTLTVDGGEIIKDDFGNTTAVSKHGKLMTPDSVDYRNGLGARQFTYNEKGEIMSFREPGPNGATYTRDEKDPTRWTGTDQYNWRGTLEFAPPESGNAATQLNIKDYFSGKTRTMNVSTDQHLITGS